MEVVLRVPQCQFHIRRGLRREQACDEFRCAFEEQPRGIALGVLDDTSAIRVRSIASDPRDLEGTGVDPSAVSIVAGDRGRAIADNGVQIAAVRESIGENVPVPPGPEHPFVDWMFISVLGDSIEIRLVAVDVVEVAFHHPQPAEDGVGVSVMEPGDQCPTVQIDHFGVGTGRCRAVGIADGDDCSRVDGDGVCC